MNAHLPSFLERLTLSFPHFTPVSSLVGGLMLSCSVNGLLILTGSALGISGFFHRSQQLLLGISAPSPPKSADFTAEAQRRTSNAVALGLTAGLIAGGAFLGLFAPSLQGHLSVTFFDSPSVAPTSASSFGLRTVVAGLLVGLGTKLGSGCTSGHFLCGLSRLSLRSIVATASFFSVAVITHLATSAPATAVRGSLKNAAAPSGDILLALATLQVPFLIYSTAVPILTSRKLRLESQSPLALLTSFSIGAHFAFGLAMTGMLRPSKVLGFLALSPARISSGSWDPSLALVAIGGILPASAIWFGSVSQKVEASRRAERTGKKSTPDPSNEPALYPSVRWSLPLQPSLITPRLVLGSALFGIGWGLSGFCPGPVLVNLGATASAMDGAVLRYAVFTATMGLGGWLGGRL